MTREEIIATIERVNEERFATIEGRHPISVSNIQTFISEEFDKEATAKKCEEKGRTNPNYKYAGMTAQQIIDMWEAKAEESKRYGRLLDEYTDFRLNNKNDELELWKLDNNFDYDERLKANCTGFEEFYRDVQSYGFQYVGRELTVYGESAEGNIVVGRIDCLFQNPATGKLFIVDWKTTDEIKTSSFGKKMKGAAFMFDDCDHSKYTIQVQVYKYDIVNTYHLATEENVNCCIVNLLKQRDATLNNALYKIFKEARPFDGSVISNIVDFSVKKRALIRQHKEATQMPDLINN